MQLYALPMMLFGSQVVVGCARIQRVRLSRLREGEATAPDTVGTIKTLSKEKREMGIIWTIVIGFIAGVIAKFIMPGPNEPQGFILTTVLGIVGAFVTTFLGQTLGWYSPGEGAGLVGAIVGAIIVLFIYGHFAGRKTT